MWRLITDLSVAKVTADPGRDARKILKSVIGRGGGKRKAKKSEHGVRDQVVRLAKIYFKAPREDGRASVPKVCSQTCSEGSTSDLRHEALLLGTARPRPLSLLSPKV